MPNYKNPKYEQIESEERLREVANKLAKQDTVAVDTEADKLDPYFANLIFIQIGTPEKAYIFNAFELDDFSPLKKVLERKKPLKILQNAKFDYKLLKVQAGLELENIYDTFLAERLITCGLQRGQSNLGALAKKYLDLELDKEYDHYNWDRTVRTGNLKKKHFEYAALDVLTLFPIFRKQFQQLKKQDLMEVAKLEFACVAPVAEMEVKGTPIDQKRWKKNIREIKEKRDEIHDKIQAELRPLYKTTQRDLFGNHVDVVNLNSPSQLIEAFAKVGIDIPSTGEQVLKKIDHALARMLLEYRGYEKLITAFGENLLDHVNPKTGRLHPDYMQIGADTGRFACSNPNLQQIPTDSEFRSCFRVGEGRKLVTADYSQAELRILAELSKDPALVSAYKEGKDLHTYTASLMFGIPEDKVCHDIERFQAKSINFGLMYGRGVRSLATQLEVSVEEGEELLQKYFKQYKKVEKWLEKVAKQAIEKGYSETVIGRKRYHKKPDPDDPNYERAISAIKRKGKNTPIQGTSADMIKYAIVFVYRRLQEEGLNAFLVHTVHDEVVVETTEEDAERVKAVVKEEMERAGELMIKEVPMKADAMVSDIWEH
ncbi:MAG: DNA polymerase [Patescibacteria group bacterium]|nr:DNA polymerase [Patescibacteria group bacterium]